MTDDIADAFEGMLEGATEDKSIEAVKMLLKDDGNIDLMSDIPESLRFSFMHVLAQYLKDKNMDKSGSFLFKLVHHYKRYRVSQDRASRGEIEEILKAMGETENKEAKELKEKMLEKR